MDVTMNHLDALEAQSVYILREAFNKFDRLGMLWSLGKDSNVMLWLAKKAFFGHVPFPALFCDTGKKFPEMYAFQHHQPVDRSEEHTSELQSLMRISYAVFCLKKKNKKQNIQKKTDK